MRLIRQVSAVAFYAVLSAMIAPAYSSIQIGTTRVIYHGSDKNVSVQLTNPGRYPVLLQSWIDNGKPDARPETIQTPFVLTPPLTRVNAGAGQTLRLDFIGNNLPADKESVYWLNVLEIPPVENKVQNEIQVAFRSRIKIFFRPRALDDKGALEAPAQVRWAQSGSSIQLTNPTPYYISALSLSLEQKGKTSSLPADMIAPQGHLTVPLSSPATLDPAVKVTIQTINDYGAVTSQLIQQ